MPSPVPIWLGKYEIIHALEEMGERPIEFRVFGDTLTIPLLVGETKFTVSITRKGYLYGPEVAEKRKTKDA